MSACGLDPSCRLLGAVLTAGSFCRGDWWGLCVRLSEEAYRIPVSEKADGSPESVWWQMGSAPPFVSLSEGTVGIYPFLCPSEGGRVSPLVWLEGVGVSPPVRNGGSASPM